jgi:hypothetical protein
MAVVFNGDYLPLNMTLPDGDETKFPQAHVFKQDGTELTGSPFNLTHVALGRYTNVNAVQALLADIRYMVTYRVYEDSGYTQESYLYNLNTEDVIDVIHSPSEDDITNFYVAIPSKLEVPSSGSKFYDLLVYFFKANGSPMDPDSNQVYIEVKDISGAVVLPSCLCTREQAGVYKRTYQVDSTSTEQPLRVGFSFVSASIPMITGAVTEVIKSRAMLSSIQNIIGNSTTGTITSDIAQMEAQIAAISSDPNILHILGIVNDIQLKLGNPTPETVTSLINAVTNTINTNLDVPVSTRAKPEDLYAILLGLNFLELTGVVDDDNDELLGMLDEGAMV